MKQETLAASTEAARARKRRPGGGRKRKRPDYDAGRNLEELMDAAAELYDAGQSLQAIADELALNPIKVRKLLITAEVYESEIAEEVRATFEAYRARQDYRAAVQATAEELRLSIPSVNSYLPYEKGVYFAATDSVEKISAGAERQRRYRAMKKWRAAPTEENLWGVVQAYAGAQFKTWSGLGFSYQLRRGRPESKKRLLVRVAALLEQKRCDEQDEKELRVAEDLRGVSRDEQPHDRAERDLHERQRDAR